MSSGSGILVNESGLGSSIGTGSGLVIGGDEANEGEGSGSDVGVGTEPDQSGSGSDVNLVASESNGSDVAIVPSDSELLFDSVASDLVEIDSAELKIDEPAVMHDSSQLDLAIEPQDGSTGPVTDEELKEIAESHPDVLAPEGGQKADTSQSNLSIPGDDEQVDSKTGSSSVNSLGSDIELKPFDSKISGDILSSGGVSSLELMSDLDLASEPADAASLGSSSAEVLSELDLLGSENKDSGLISGDSDNVLASSGIGDSALGSSIGDAIHDSELSGLDDALEDDDLIISDDDDDLVLGSSASDLGGSLGSDLSVAGESGINLMSPSDSGLSLEGEPSDLIGSSISALDLGAELADGSGIGSGSGGGSGSGVDFQADEEFQLSPSGVGLEADIESGSQVIEIEDSGAIGEAVEIADDAFADAQPLEDGDVFAAEPAGGEGGFGDEGGFGGDGEAIEIADSVAPVGAATAAYEIPFSTFQCVGLMMILLIMGLSGMLMTDLVRNMWAYSEASAPVSSLTDALISLMGWNP